MQAIRVNRLKPAIRNFCSPPRRDPHKKGVDRWPPTIYHHHKGLPIQKRHFRGGGVRIVRTQEKRKIYTTPGLHWWYSWWLLWGWCADCGARVEFGDPETIRENQAIRANLRIDSHKSGHLRTPQKTFLNQVVFLWGWCSNCRNLKKKAKYTQPPVLHSRCWSSILWGSCVDFTIWWWWFPNGGSSFVWSSNSPTPF